MKKSTILRQLLEKREALVVPGAHDVLSAKLIEKVGFKALQVSGFGLAATLLGLPDMAFLSFEEMRNFTRNIVDAVNIPVMADADTGFGNAINAMYVTEKLIKAGCASMNIEDQMFPKRCGHIEGKTIVPCDEMVLKIKACAKVRDELDPDFVINARTDSIAVSGIDEAIRRGNAYAEAGADMIFVEAPRTIEEIERAVKEIDALVSINFFDSIEGGKTPLLPVNQMKELGVARISVPVGSVFAAAKGVQNYLEAIKDDIAPDRKEVLFSFDEFKNIVGVPGFREQEKEYLPKFVD
ncbi:MULTISPECIES: isocitrate lyase/PEP mutase family protein [Aminobacterium]|uniref:2,3-dimethylmalate lyase n=1 Tax=Aminobacterium colombiense (strain DSM 12261 / ALA-1) TaxID=572547 RepID=D5EDE9_AMICL|nr:MULTISPECIES: isocitrate lyase/PEP mutase family protein [Aminobacterium]MDD2379102.1 isocitrate lyase/PEP mutase family protein [Aminobacterium colombiense]ADE56581.1 2,3-dimethylmalate lyase [Aminobacterium colombiense DSM 12261]MDD3768723.1 isocitrate lyase/PEP mutase family protein [Aminobacterium colombiense]MDD4265212.1 isocitrate lyase/PEP mutase family protein [Aminobacterium colombiense]MDD4585783.1 isocitrate lyase/PEP mutase family protein [Aminobacterium colombiense]